MTFNNKHKEIYVKKFWITAAVFLSIFGILLHCYFFKMFLCAKKVVNVKHIYNYKKVSWYTL